MFILMRRFANSGVVMKCFGALMRLIQLHEMKCRFEGKEDKKGGASVEMFYLASLNSLSFSLSVPSPVFIPSVLAVSSFPNVKLKVFALISCSIQTYSKAS